MRSTAMIVAMLSFLFVCLEADSQSLPPSPGNQRRSATDQKIIDLPLSRHQFRPKLSLQSALKIADGYIEKEHIDISSYWLYRANFILYGDQGKNDKDKDPCWHFWWVNNNGSIGDYVEIIVSMDGKAGRLPSM